MQNEKKSFPEMISESFQKADYHVLFASQREAYEIERKSQKSVFILSSDNMRYFLRTLPDIFVAPPGLKNISGGEKIACRSAVLCGEDASTLSEYIVSERIVTYGMSPKDTLTVSSAVDNVTIALQREIIALTDETIEMQEVRIPMEDCADLNRLMAIACVMLLAGIPFMEIQGLL